MTRNPLLEVFLYFFKLGLTAFGGPAVHIAMMDDELVKRREWVTRERFADLFGAASLLPGPTSTELALLLGRERAGLFGLLAAGVAFILPAFTLVSIIAALYIPRDATPAADAVMRGIQPATILIIAQALVPLLHTVLKRWNLWLCAGLATALALLNINILWILLAAALFNLVLERVRSPGDVKKAAAMLLLTLQFHKRVRAEELRSTAAAGAAAMALAPGLWTLGLSFLKIGAVFYGSGYVLLAFLREDFVIQRHWLTEKQLITAIAVGQFTPGPLFTTATFVGCQVHGFLGGCVATAGIFAPAFIYSIAAGALVPHIRRWSSTKFLLEGVNAAACTLMAVVACQLGAQAFVDWKTAAVGAGSAVLLWVAKLNPAGVIVLAGLVGRAWL